MKVTEADCEYASFNEFSDGNICQLSINLELWDKKPRVIEIPKTLRKNGKTYKVTEFKIWRGYYGREHKVIVRYPHGVRHPYIYIDNYEIDEVWD